MKKRVYSRMRMNSQLTIPSISEAYLLISNIDFRDEVVDILSFVHGCHDLLSNFFDLSQIDI